MENGLDAAKNSEVVSLRSKWRQSLHLSQALHLLLFKGLQKTTIKFINQN